MRRRLVHSLLAAGLAVGGAVVAAGPASAAPPKETGEHDCGFPAVCHPGQHSGWINGEPPGRNVGG